MAAKTGILGINQDISTEPLSYVKDCVADLMVRRLTHERISRRLIRALPIRPATDPRIGRDPYAPTPRYIPEYLPSAELLGITIEGIDPSALRNEMVLARVARHFCERHA